MTAEENMAVTAADRLAAMRHDDQRAAALRGVRPTALLDELAAELERRGAAEPLALVHAEQGRRAEIRAENDRIVAAAVALRERRDKVITTFERGMVVPIPGCTDRTTTLMHPSRTTTGVDSWWCSSARWGTGVYGNDELADAVLAAGGETS